ncbi:hypothetical protein SCLCIDRAFT_11221 [Scleroderma citrinum Foug A]|uniref:Uncharacterized protein n=1 Tax=Scleroderma citrinum Foug A TaxID=1036808 RepID=A0A0C3DF30_9AGAM|nr:hypothetical protein SCLCIDRAFT_11221 [Scleroderma citrinum Foug A]
MRQALEFLSAPYCPTSRVKLLGSSALIVLVYLTVFLVFVGLNAYMLTVMPPYHRFLSSAGVRFPGQTGIDIQLTDWRDNPHVPRVRQRATALAAATGASFISPKAYLGMVPDPVNGGQVELWGPFPFYLPAMQVVNFGPSQPHVLAVNAAQPPPYPYLENAVVEIIGGIPTVGYGIPWYHKVEEQLVLVRPQQLHYYQHRRPRDNPLEMPVMVPNGTHHAIEILHFGTQVNKYCLAKLR